MRNAITNLSLISILFFFINDIKICLFVYQWIYTQLLILLNLDCRLCIFNVHIDTFIIFDISIFNTRRNTRLTLDPSRAVLSNSYDLSRKLPSHETLRQAINSLLLTDQCLNICELRNTKLILAITLFGIVLNNYQNKLTNIYYNNS